MKKERNSNIEILRIIAMLFIVISHYTVHSGINLTTLPLGVNRFILEVTRFGNIGVIIFMLISGYNLIEQKSIQLKKALKLYLQILFYSVVVYLVFIMIGLETFSISGLIKNSLPFIFNRYWFATAYIILYLLSPFINKFLHSLSRKEHLTFLAIMLILFSIIPTFTNQNPYGNQLVQFLMFYSIGAYLKKYNDNLFNKKKVNTILLISSISLLVLSVIALDFLGNKMGTSKDLAYYFFNRRSIISILFSVTFFNLFVNKKPFSNKFINKIAICAFGVYLIHDNKLVKGVLWELFENTNYFNSGKLIIHMIITIIIVYTACTIIEYIRINLVERPFFKVLGNKIDKLELYLKTKLLGAK